MRQLNDKHTNRRPRADRGIQMNLLCNWILFVSLSLSGFAETSGSAIGTNDDGIFACT